MYLFKAYKDGERARELDCVVEAVSKEEAQLKVDCAIVVPVDFVFVDEREDILFFDDFHLGTEHEGAD